MILLLVCTCLSASVTVFEGPVTLNWSDGTNLDGSLFASVKAGDRLVVTTENGGCKVALNYPWTDLVSGDGPTTEYVFAEDMISDIKSSGIRIQGGEEVTLVKVVIESDGEPAAEPADNKTVVATLLDTPQTIGNWDNTIEVSGDKFTEAGAKAGDFLRVNYTVTEEGAQIQLCANSPEWHNILPCADVTSTAKYVEMELTAETIENLVADKLYVQGKQLTVESVQIVRDQTETKVNTVNAADAGNGAIYTLGGVRLTEKPRHGMYILNGKKYIIR